MFKRQATLWHNKLQFPNNFLFVLWIQDNILTAF
jgi:hypothetical protein